MDSESRETPLSLIRSERKGDLPVWKDFNIIGLPGVSSEGRTEVIQVKNSTRTQQSMGRGVTLFNHSYGLTVSGINYCQRAAGQPLENVELVFGYAVPELKQRLGSSVSLPASSCKRFKLPKGDCITGISIGGTFAVQRLLMNTLKGAQFIAGSANSAVFHWDTFVNKEACLTGVHGLALNSSIISLGLYFNPEVKPDGKVYAPW